MGIRPHIEVAARRRREVQPTGCGSPRAKRSTPLAAPRWPISQRRDLRRGRSPRGPLPEDAAIPPFSDEEAYSPELAPSRCFESHVRNLGSVSGPAVFVMPGDRRDLLLSSRLKDSDALRPLYESGAVACFSARQAKSRQFDEYRAIAPTPG